MSELDRRRFLLSSAVTAPVLGVGGASSAAAERRRAPDGRVRTGADVLAAEGWRRLRGTPVGVIANPTSALSEPRAGLPHIVDDMHSAAGVTTAAVFGPEHGFRGTAQAGGSEGDHTDPRTGIPVYDTYGADVGGLAGMLRDSGVRHLVFDIADVGARFYTYIWTMYTAMRAAVRTEVPFTVLDRPNPLGGSALGPVLDPGFASGVGELPVAQQHGMTVGELARMFDAEFLPRDENARLPRLEVVRARGWSRELGFADTGLPWIAPSPNMPTPDTAAVYPGTGMFEGTVLSEGRGTTRPFETIGAPGIDWRWAEQLNSAGLAGVFFNETYFVPTFSKHEGSTCGGVRLHRTGSGDFDAIRTAVAMIVHAKRLYPDVFGWRADNWIDRLTGSDRLRRMVDRGADTAEVVGAWRAELDEFRRAREPYLLYR
ncbi:MULTISPECIES: DUF1343 domain-containing protein [unclassified Actinopolyspora]|uniref:exo-beta-N-acetylmuramidase NamZ family protein n=1 Tax=unclassified Actinopolyspora TaxID=2639451 RepID=UPI0013F5E7B9|nr:MULTISPECIES: DUF1343 domain-containing protein [unclassified Actinopolyspora]NHD19178.1 DUF1343 domain-containing protein [Actinopolyspora sp. BKK2]NHE78302.1 DUF1343 domain-containing protein [Actinopolyspora sp. BKK1]